MVCFTQIVVLQPSFKCPLPSKPPQPQYIRINVVQRILAPESSTLQQQHNSANNSNSPYKLCGIPFVLYFPNDTIKVDTLYYTVWAQVQRMYSTEKKHQKHALPIQLSQVNAMGYYCDSPLCKATEQCHGCNINFDANATVTLDNDSTIAVNWYHQDLFNAKESLTVALDDSVRVLRERMSRETVTLQDCLNTYAEVEQLSEQDSWVCNVL